MARRARPVRLLTLTSDLGSAYAAQVKAVVLRQVPTATIVDLAHDLVPHDVGEAGFLLRAMAERFPSGTVHVAVVDPGVGGPRAPLVIRCSDGSLLVGPDNGVLLPLAEALGRPRAFRLDPRRFAPRSRVGTTFDGRDVFAPAAAALLLGQRPESLGTPVVPLPFPRPPPVRLAAGARGTVAHVDRFGNVVTDVPSRWVPSGAASIGATLGRRRFRFPWSDRYEGRSLGAWVALGSSFGTVELAAHRASAAARLRVLPGTPLRLDWRPSRRTTGK